jgi:hypothetical protein
MKRDQGQAERILLLLFFSCVLFFVILQLGRC